VVREQDEVDTALECESVQRRIARAARPRLDAVAGARRPFDAARGECQRSAATRPAPARRFAVAQPRVGVGAQAVVDVQREDRDPERRGGAQRRVQKRSRIAAAAVGDGDGARSALRGCVSARSCR
jgi:hypothetical protein